MKLPCLAVFLLLITKCNQVESKIYNAELVSVDANGSQIYSLSKNDSDTDYSYVLPNGLNDLKKVDVNKDLRSDSQSEYLQIKGVTYEVDPQFRVSEIPRDTTPPAHQKWHITGILDSTFYRGEKYFFLAVGNDSSSDYVMANSSLSTDMSSYDSDSVDYYIHYYEDEHKDSIYHNIIIEDEYHDEMHVLAIDTTINNPIIGDSISDIFPIARYLSFFRYHIHYNGVEELINNNGF